jgi:hypothetical protein
MISISPQVQSSYFIFLREMASSKIKEYTRRVSRTATLDGSSVITDSGYTDTDRTLEIRARITAAQESIITYLMETYSLLTVVTDEGCYTCAPQRWSFPPVAGPDDPNAILTLLISP